MTPPSPSPSSRVHPRSPTSAARTAGVVPTLTSNAGASSAKGGEPPLEYGIGDDGMAAYEPPALTEVGSVREMTLGGANLQDWSDEIRLWRLTLPAPGEFS